MIKGCFPVLCTPFREDGSIDGPDFDALVEFVVASGSDGCVYPGVASEVGALTPQERSEMVARLGRRLAGRLPFVVGGSDPSPEAVLAHVEAGARAGAVAAMVMAPSTLGHDIDAQVAFFARIGAGSLIPLMLQNAPSPIGAGLSPEAVAAIARAVPAVAYIKEETLPCGQNLSRIRAACGDAILGVFGGAGGRYVTDELARGSLGTMPAAEFADLHAALLRAWDRGDEAEARRLFEVTLPALNHQAVFRMHMTKATLRRRGALRHVHVRAPGPHMDEGDRAELDTLLDRLAPELALFPLDQRALAS